MSAAIDLDLIDDDVIAHAQDVAEALALHQAAVDFLRARARRLDDATCALARAVTDAVDARDELEAALALVAESSRLVAMRKEAR